MKRHENVQILHQERRRQVMKRHEDVQRKLEILHQKRRGQVMKRHEDMERKPKIIHQDGRGLVMQDLKSIFFHQSGLANLSINQSINQSLQDPLLRAMICNC